MPQTLTFTKVFKAEGEKNGKSWTRWDYKTANNDRFVHFAGSQELPLNEPVTIEENNGAISSFSVAGGQNGSSNGSQAVRSDPVASQAHQDDIAGKIRTYIAGGLAGAMFSALPAEEQNFENAKTIGDKLVQWCLGDTIPY